jgi:lycopene cyclase domain-containing protein
MTYAQFLAVFLLIPITLLAFAMRRHLSWREGRWLALLMLIALVYTTPWDNYLVASRVWWYDPDQVAGVTLGWVPVEEYIFFLLQPLMTGLWVLYLNRQLPPMPSNPYRRKLRSVVASGIGVVWTGAVVGLAIGWQPGNYLSLILAWALPPIALQMAFGADILWGERQRVVLGLFPASLHLSAADALAIRAGTWTINPELSLEVYLASVLPLEEFVFFLLTNTLVVFAVVLLLSTESHRRLQRTVSEPFV